MRGASSTSHQPASLHSHHVAPSAPTFPSWLTPIATNVPSHPCRLYFLPLPSTTPPVPNKLASLSRVSISQSALLEWSPPVADVGRVLALLDTACTNGFSCHHILRQKSQLHPTVLIPRSGCL